MWQVWLAVFLAFASGRVGQTATAGQLINQQFVDEVRMAPTTKLSRINQDATYTTDIPDNAGIAIFNNNCGEGN